MYIGFYYSLDATIKTSGTGRDTYLNRVYVRSLNVGASYPTTANGTILVRIPSSARGKRTVYLGAYADYSKRVAETNEADTDNGKAAAVKIVTSIADLSMSTWTVKPTTVAGYNSTVNIDFRVRNNGSAGASNCKVTFYYGNSSRTTGLVEIGSKTIRRIDPRTTDSTESLTGLKIPKSVLNGTRYIHYFIDSGNTVNESYEFNNRGRRTLTVSALPNLQVSVLSVQPTSQGGGGQVSVSYRVYNAGLTAAANFKMGVYLSSNSTIDNTDTLLQTITVALLPAQTFLPGTSNGTLTVRIPKTAKTGAAYLGMFVDYEAKVKELRENDNTKAVRFTVSAPQSDLVPVNAKVAPGTQKTGQSVNLTYTIANRGGATAALSQMGIYYSKDAIFDSGDILIKNVTVTALKSGFATTRTEAVKLPTAMPAGLNYLVLFVDNNTKISESNEKNNTTSVKLTVLTDKDKDKVYSDKDCNDNDKSIYPGAPELCDGKDNDCNKKIDDNSQCTCVTGKTRACFTGSSGCVKTGTTYTCTPNTPCKAGTQKCVNGKWESTCAGEVLPQTETCNNKDDNCDGKIDENLTQKCYGGPNGTAGVGLCKAGLKTCTNGVFSACVGEVKPVQESCDGEDNDCDGKIDNQKGGSKALEQPCTSSCGNGVETCRNKKWTGCTAPQTCSEGTTEIPQEPTVDGGPADQPVSDQKPDCYTASCPSGEICQKGQCIPDPCAGIKCSPDEFCRNGQCVKACDCKRCAANEKCEDGQCVSDPCAGTTCPSGKICDPNSGQCQDDPCQGITCGVGRVCQAGVCVDDPCGNINCPQGQSCRNGQCVGTACVDEESSSTETSTPDAGTDGGAGNEGTTDSSTGNEGTTDTSTTDDSTATDNSTATDDSTATDNSTATDDSTATKESGSTTDIGTGTDLAPPGGGCGCHHEQANPVTMLLFLFGLIAFIGLRRRRNRA